MIPHSHIRYAGRLRVGERVAVGAEGVRGVDERAVRPQRVRHGARPAQAPHRRAVQRRHQRQVRVEVVELAQGLHHLQHLAGVLLTLSGFVL